MFVSSLSIGVCYVISPIDPLIFTEAEKSKLRKPKFFFYFPKENFASNK